MIGHIPDRRKQLPCAARGQGKLEEVKDELHLAARQQTLECKDLISTLSNKLLI